jgi:hypothetical protein
MTTTTAFAGEMLRVELAERQQVDNARPDGEAPRQVGHQFNVESLSRTRVSRVHGATILSVIAATQIVWFVALGYGVFRLLA